MNLVLDRPAWLHMLSTISAPVNFMADVAVVISFGSADEYPDYHWRKLLPSQQFVKELRRLHSVGDNGKVDCN